MVRWLRWHCHPDTGFEIRALAVWGRACYLSITEAPHNTDFQTWMGKKHFLFFQTVETENRTPNSGVKGSGANHYPRAPALYHKILFRPYIYICFHANFRLNKIPPKLVTSCCRLRYSFNHIIQFGTNSSFEWMKNTHKQFSSTRVNIFKILEEKTGVNQYVACLLSSHLKI